MKKLCFICLFVSINVLAAPVRFDFVFDDPNSTARTEGYIVFEESLVANPGSNTFTLPDPAVIDLQLTVTGSIDSDGQYDINDYAGIDFWTNGGTLDFSQPLIGQATNNAPWGTALDGSAGDFNLFPQGGFDKSSSQYNNNRGIVGGPPFGCNYFTLCESDNQGGGNGITPKGGPPGGPGGLSPMELQSMQPNRGTPVQSVPSLTVWSTITLGVVFLVMASLFRRRLN